MTFDKFFEQREHLQTQGDQKLVKCSDFEKKTVEIS